MELRLLGPLEVVDDDGRPIDLAGAKLRALLVLLALRPGETVPTARIVEHLWGERDIRDPVNAVQVLVSKLRRALRPGGDGADRNLVVTSATGYSLSVAPEAVDAIRFERLANQARALLESHDPAGAAALFQEALSLWRGEALADFADDDFTRGDRARLEELRASALEHRVEAELALGRHEEVVAELEGLVVAYPLREALRAHQMVALYRCGRQADALRAFQAARTALGEEVGLDPGPELQRLEAAILTQDPSLDLPVGSAPAASKGNLPAPPNAFIGRVAELEELGALLKSHRLVTVVGPGGAGKTRLALEAAHRAATAKPDGCWFIELAPLSDPVLVENAAAAALGLDDAGRLDGYLHDRRLLIVLDNCEHLVDAAAAMARRLLRAGDGVSILATSREALAVAGERRWVLPPLDASDANTLFVDRAVAGGLSHTDAQSVVVDEICERLDGLPLAIELAAARTRALSLDDIAARIDDRFRLLTTGDRSAEPRQQTLRNLVDWSYDLLFEDEQRVFRRLSVFAGGFGVRAAEAVCAGDDVPCEDVMDTVARLAEKSLVSVASRDGDTRYQLLQTVADYGRSKLVEAGESEATRDRHLAWVRALAADARWGLRSVDQHQWAAVLTRERANVRAAVDRALDCGRVADATAIVAGMAYGWYITGMADDGQLLLNKVLAEPGDAPAIDAAVAHAWAAWLTQFGAGMTDQVVDHAERAVALARTSEAAVFGVAAVIASLVRSARGLTDAALELIEEADARLEHDPDGWAQAWVDWTRSGLALKLGDPDRARALLRRSVEGFAGAGDRCGGAIAAIRLSELAESSGDQGEAMVAAVSAYETILEFATRGFNASTLASRIGNLAALEGRFGEADEWHGKAMARALESGYPGALAQALSGMALAARLRGRPDDAEDRYREALGIYEAAGSVEGAAATLASLGFLAADRGDHDTASELHRRGLREAARGNDRRAVALAVEGLAEAAMMAGDGPGAARLLGAAGELRRASGGALPSLQLGEVDRTEDGVRALIGPDALQEWKLTGAAEAEDVVAVLLSPGLEEIRR